MQKIAALLLLIFCPAAMFPTTFGGGRSGGAGATIYQSFPAPGPGRSGVGAPPIGTITHIQALQGACDGGSSSGLFSGTSCPTGNTRTTSNITAGTTGNGFIVAFGCGSSTAPTSLTVTATGWTFTQVGNITGYSGSYMAKVRAYAPNTTAGGWSITWGGVTNCTFMNIVGDEFNGVNATNFIDTDVANGFFNASTGGCSTSNTITPSQSGTTIWAACNDSASGVGSGFTKGADDTQGDWTQYKIGAAGGSQSAAFTSTGGYVQLIVAIK